MRFSEVRHQDRAISILRRALRSGRTHHAYLFEGPEGVGKERAARALAARLLCGDAGLAPDADACGRCRSCRLLAVGNHPDFHLIERGLHRVHPDRAVRASKGLFLAVDLIRHFVIEPAGLKPTQGARRVFVVRDAERMNEEAQNALLKTLEEPPGSAVLVLVTAFAARLLPTIRSRCQQVPFDRLPAAFVAQQLAALAGVPRAAADALAGLADGRLGVALRWYRVGLLEQLEPVGECVEALAADRDVEAFGRGIVERATELAGRAVEAEGREAEEPAEEETGGEAAGPAGGGQAVPTDALRDALRLVLLLVAALYRDALLTAHGAGSLCGLRAQAERTARLAAGAPPDELEARLRAVGEAERLLDRNVAPQLACEYLAAALLGEVPVW